MADKLSLKCKSCGHEVTAENEDALVKKIQQHNKEQHNMDTPEEEARKAIKERATKVSE
mgnify:CR=1 FL=1